MRDGVLRDRLMREEIELEALPQHRFVDLADPALPGGAGIRDDDIDAAERLGHAVEGGAHRSRRRSRRRRDRAPRRRAFWPPPAAASAVDDRAAPPRRRRARIARAVAAPIVPAPPVTTATWPASGFSAACRAWPARATSIPCRTCRLRDSDSNRPIASASVTVATVGFGDVGGDRARPSRCARARTGRAPAPGRPAAAGRARASAPPGARLWRAK